MASEKRRDILTHFTVGHDFFFLSLEEKMCHVCSVETNVFLCIKSDTFFSSELKNVRFIGTQIK